MSLDNSGNIPNMGSMTQRIELTATDIRQALITRAEAFAKANKTSFSAMGIAAVGDSKFLSRVQNPATNFNIKTYQRMVDWLDQNEAVHAESAA